MSKARKYGYQPVSNIIVDDGRTLTAFARSLQSDTSHALLAMAGRIPPSPALRAELPMRLNVPLDVLFTKAALDATYHGPRGHVVSA